MGKYFKNKVKKNQKSQKQKKLIILISAAVVGLILLILLIVSLVKLAKKEKLVLKDSIDLEVKSNLPDKKDFFSTYKNVNEGNIVIDLDNLNVDEIGEYDVFVSYPGNEHKTVKINVKDTTKPVLSLKNLSIEKGTEYGIGDFIDSCTDNYGDCFLSMDLDTLPTEEGEYKIKIKAADSSNNFVEQEAELKIEPKKSACSYGDLIVADNFKDVPVVYYAGNKETGCAADPRLATEEDMNSKLTAILNTDIEKVKTEINDKYSNDDGNNMIVKPTYYVVYNSSRDGFIGYAIRIKIYLDNSDNLKEDYYITSQNTRKYIVNSYNLN